MDWAREEGLPRPREDPGVHLGSGRTASRSGGSVKQGRFPRQKINKWCISLKTPPPRHIFHLSQGILHGTPG